MLGAWNTRAKAGGHRKRSERIFTVEIVNLPARLRPSKGRKPSLNTLSDKGHSSGG